MAIAKQSQEYKTVNGNITVPAGCSLIIAIVKGGNTAPVVNGTAMEPIKNIAVNGIMPAAGVFQTRLPAIGVLTFTFVGIYTELVYFSGALSYRDGAVIGQSATGSILQDMVTSTADYVLAAIFGNIGPTSLKGDTVAMTYLLNTTLDKIGYITPGDNLLTCLAQDTGVSAGYTVDGGGQTHGSVLVRNSYVTYEPVVTAGHYITVYSPVYGNIRQWVPPYTTYVATYHPEEWSTAWYEEFPDTWVPGGAAASISAIFISITEIENDDWVPPAIFFN